LEGRFDHRDILHLAHVVGSPSAIVACIRVARDEPRDEDKVTGVVLAQKMRLDRSEPIILVPEAEKALGTNGVGDHGLEHDWKLALGTASEDRISLGWPPTMKWHAAPNSREEMVSVVFGCYRPCVQVAGQILTLNCGDHG
jgi:hypothetical protein